MTKKYVSGLSNKLVTFLKKYPDERFLPNDVQQTLNMSTVGSIAIALAKLAKNPNSGVGRIKRPNTNFYEYWAKTEPEKREVPALAINASIADKVAGAEALLTHVSEQVHILNKATAALISSVEDANLFLIDVKEELAKKPNVDEDLLRAVKKINDSFNID